MKKVFLVISVTILLLFFVACNRDVSSEEYILRKVEDDLQEVFSISYVSAPVLKQYIINFHKEVNSEDIQIHDKANIAMVYGTDYEGKEKLVFIPDYGTSKIIHLAITNPFGYRDTQEKIKEDYPDYELDSIKAELITREVIEDQSVIFGFPLTVNDTTVVYYFFEDQLVHLLLD